MTERTVAPATGSQEVKHRGGRAASYWLPQGSQS